MSNKDNDILREAVALLKQQADEQAKVSSSLEGYLDGLKKLKAINETLLYNDKEITKLLEKQADTTQDLTDIEKARLKILQDTRKQLEKEGKQLRDNLAVASKTNLILSKMAASAVKTLANFNGIPPIISKTFNKIKASGLFEMDKAIKTASLQMGLLGNESINFTSTIRDAALDTNAWGMGVQELAKMQSDYSDELGRTVMLGKIGLDGMSKMAAATALGAEGAAQMAAEMNNQGISAERTAEYIEKTLDSAHKMGLNASKVIKNVQQNLKLLNKYNFKNGADGLAKMAKYTAKMGVSMEFAASFADKLWDVEGAVDMSAQLQVLGGEWSKLADPFKLMYQARNDVAGLTESLVNAASASATFNAKNGDFEISAMEMHRLKIVADQANLSYDELAKSAKNAAQFAGIKKQINYSFDPDTKDFIAATSQLDKNGKATIEINGNPKLVSLLNQADQTALNAQVKAKKSLEERAKASQTFDDKLTNLINMFKTTLLPVVDGLNNVLSPVIDNLFNNPKFIAELKDLGNKIGSFIGAAAGWVKTVAGWAIALGPTGTLALLLGAKGLMSVSSWYLNGIALAKGFNTSANIGSGVGNSVSSGGKMSSGFNLAGKAMLAGNIIDLGVDAYQNATDESLSKTDAFLKTLDENKGKIALGILGGLLAPFTGGLSIAAAAGIGATLGSVADSQMGTVGTYGTPTNDGVFPASKNKSDFTKGRGIIQGGKVHPIDNKDDLLALKPRGVVDSALKNKKTSDTMKVEFGDIKFSGHLTIDTPGNPGIAVDLLKNQSFINSITRLVHTETKKQINGGKVQP